MLKKNKLLIICLCFTLLLSFSPMAYAYTIAPGYWPDNSFPYSVDSSASGWTSIIASAASSWNNISGYPVSIFSSSAETFIRQVNRSDVGWSGNTWYYPASGMHTQAYVDLIGIIYKVIHLHKNKVLWHMNSDT
ncbi:MAG: hypothetical protein WA118_11140 [Carboxydocellales bacterium]